MSKQKRPVKPPKIFRKPVPEKKFNKKILKRIYVEKEKEFLLSLVTRDSSGSYVLKDELDKKSAKRLKALMKSVKKNKGVVTGWKAAILIVIIGAGVVFNFLFKDKLLEKGMETGLSAVFHAPASVEQVHLKILSGSISFSALSVADKDKPDTNLFELGASELKVNLRELLKKRLVIDRIVADGIAAGTTRSVNVAETGISEGSDTGDAGSSVDPGGGLISDMDPQAILDGQISRLESPEYIATVNDAYSEAVDTWPARIDNLDNDLAAGRRGAEKIAAINVSSIDSPEEVAAALKIINDNSPAVEKAVKTAGDTSADFNRNRKELLQLQEGISDAVAADYSLLEEAIGNPTGTLKGIVSQAAENILRAKIGGYYDKAMKAIDAAKGLKKESPDNEKKKTVLSRKGELVYFPVQGFPRFLIQEFRVSGGAEGSDSFMRLTADDINSDPDIWGKPFAYAWDSSTGGIDITASGEVDVRSSADTVFSLNAGMEGGNFDAGEVLSGLGVKALSGSAEGSLTFSVSADGKGRGEGLVILGAFQGVYNSSGDPLSDAVREILEETESAEFRLEFEAEGNEISSFRISSTLDSVLAEKAGEYLKGRADELKEEVKQALQDELKTGLEENKELSNLFDQYGGDLGKGLEEADNLSSSVDEKRAALEKRSAEIAGGLQDQAKDLLDKAGSKLKLSF